jgi:Bacteriocin-protection, YdeI or OmpD-Associated/Domain of unknown function (DUF1905)
MKRFSGELRQNERGGTTVEIPFDVAAAFGSARAPVRATVNGFTFRTRTMRYGGVYLVGLNAEARAGARVKAGDPVTVELELDEEPREVAVPPPLASALEREPELHAFFDSLSYTHRREYARWIAEAKREDTRRRRVERAVELLRARVRTPD